MANRYLIGTGARNWIDNTIWGDASGGGNSNQLGPELVTNGGAVGATDWIDSDADGLADTIRPWRAGGVAAYMSYSIVTGNGFTGNAQRCVVVSPGTYGGLVFTVTVGKIYKISFKYRSNYTISLQNPSGTYFYGTSPTNTGNAIYFERTFYASTTDAGIGVLRQAGDWCEFDEVSLKECLSVPTVYDNVIFDANSGTGILTVNSIANMANFDCSGMTTNAITLSNAAFNFNVYGSLALSTMLSTSFTGTGYLYLKATSSVNITSNGNNQGWNRIYFDGVGGTWTNQDDWTTPSDISIANGHWNINNKTISFNSFFHSNGVRIISLGSGTFICTNWGLYATTLTFNYNTGTVIVNGSFSFYRNINFYNLTLNPPASGLVTLGIDGNSTDILILNNLVLTGQDSNNNRFLLRSSVVGTPRTITVDPAKVTASNVDFRDIVFANPVNLSSIPGGSGDCGGNSGIIFTSSQTKYFKHTSGVVNWGDPTKWFSDQAKTIPGRVPLPQDSAIFDQDSFSGISTLTLNCARVGSFDMSAVNKAVTFTLGNSLEAYGHYILGQNITQNGFKLVILCGRSNFVFNSYGKFTSIDALQLNAPGGLYTNMSDVICSTAKDRELRMITGSFDFNDYDFWGNRIIANSGLPCTLYLGNGTMNCSGSSDGYVFMYGGTLYAEGSTIKCSPASGLLDYKFGNACQLNIVEFGGNHTGTFTIQGNNTFKKLVVKPGKKLLITAGTTQTIQAMDSQGTEALPIQITSTSTSAYNLAVPADQPDIDINYANISYSNATPGRFFAGDNSTDGGNNTGVTFGRAFYPIIMTI